jgi:excisionase family DNA binding protein
MSAHKTPPIADQARSRNLRSGSMLEQKLRKEQGLLTLLEAAERLGIGLTTLYRCINAGELKSVHFGSNHLVSERDLEAYIARMGVRGP